MQTFVTIQINFNKYIYFNTIKYFGQFVYGPDILWPILFVANTSLKLYCPNTILMFYPFFYRWNSRWQKKNLLVKDMGGDIYPLWWCSIYCCWPWGFWVPPWTKPQKRSRKFQSFSGIVRFLRLQMILWFRLKYNYVLWYWIRPDPSLS